jgi:hypothetical protein
VALANRAGRIIGRQRLTRRQFERWEHEALREGPIAESPFVRLQAPCGFRFRADQNLRLGRGGFDGHCSKERRAHVAFQMRRCRSVMSRVGRLPL